MYNKIIFVLVLFISFVYPQTNVKLLSNLDDYHSAHYNDIWGYVDPSGNEYALLGVRTGTSIISLADPSNPVEIAFIPATNSIWRDIKIYDQYAYVVSDGTSDGLQIIDLTQLPNSATLAVQLNTWFDAAHNIFIDNGYAYVIGTNNFAGGMHILDLSNPTSPTRTATYTASGYIHDVYVWDDTVVVCAGSSGEYHLVDVSNKSNPQFISASTPIPGIYAHSGWMTEDKRYFYATEEFNQIDISVWDLQDRSSWELVVPSWETNSGATVHNLFFVGNYAHISYYSDGYVILDISDPLNPILVGQYTTPDMWGCYPFLPSGITICSDMSNGLYVFQFTPNDVPPAINLTPVDDVLNSDPVIVTAQIIDNQSVIAANLRFRISSEIPPGEWILLTDQNGPTGNTYEFEIPGFQNQTVIEYYISAQDNNDHVSTSPGGGSGVNPPGNISPPIYYSYIIMIPGTPLLLSVSPQSDTTISPSGVIPFHVEANDTSGFPLSYSYYKNSDFVDGDATYIYVAATNPDVPRVDTIHVEVSNGSSTASFSWLVTVDSPSNILGENQIISFSLNQNYPNPFNPSTNINFSIPESGQVTLRVFNIIGEQVAELINEFMEAGNYNVNFSAADLSTGIYLAKLSSGDNIGMIKMSLMK